MRKMIIAVLAFATLVGCSTSWKTAKPEFTQRAAPGQGQSEIELLARIEGTLAIDYDSWCLGVITAGGNGTQFTTIVWPSNAELQWASGRWQVENTQTGETIIVGSKLRGSGGYLGDFDAQSLRRYNRFLAENLSADCAAKGAFVLNREFRPVKSTPWP